MGAIAIQKLMLALALLFSLADSMPYDFADFSAIDSEAEPSVLSFFNGVPHAEGVKAYNNHLATEAKRS